LERCRAAVDAAWEEKAGAIPPEVLRSIEKSVLLQTLDRLWRHHLQALDFLRKGIGLRGYAQKDPLNEYAKESFMLFEEMLAQVKREVVGLLARVQLVPAQNADAPVPTPTKEAAPRTPKKPLPPKAAGKGRSSSSKSARR
ncbi:MAG: preprotein translocase subunit SecA, partial [Alphaproteobacteria bacterium]|nr:preprotein translocase subunit SecA [Alphaproteobacteria bacterium]